ncbi:MAG: DUF992 domain-containing protein [Methylocella sp.]
MNKSILPRLSAWLAGVVFLGLAAGVAAAAPVRTGLLECNVAPGVGLLVASSRALSCVFSTHHHREYYTGTIDRVGLDVGFTTGGRFVWAVFSAGPVRPFALAGQFVGVGGDASLGGGLSANALVGGFGRSISLQPLSVGVQTGLNLSAGVGSITLEPTAAAAR